MQVEITPEPTPTEQAALEQALAALVAPTDTPGRGEWWRQGIRENAVDDEDLYSEPDRSERW
jgi:hypothetical protein